MSITGQELLRVFLSKYSPYLLKDYIVPERNNDEIKVDRNHPEQLAMMNYIDSQRAKDAFIGAKIAGQEIFVNITNWLKNDKGVHAETLLAVIGSVGGRECVNGIMSTLKSLISDDVPDKRKLENAVAGMLDIFIAETKNGEQYIMGDRIANTFCSFYNTAASENVAVDNLRKLAAETASNAGKSEYWKTPFDDYVKHSPKELADLFEGKFEPTFDVYCRFPYERMMSFAVAAQKAVKQVESIMPKEKALSILAEFGWRTSHYNTLK